MSAGRNFRRITFSLFLLVFAFTSVITAPFASSAETTYQVVVHVPGVVGVVPADARVTLTDDSNSSNQTQSRLVGQDSYGWFGVVDLPAGATRVKVSATRLTASSISIDPISKREIWLSSKGVPSLYESVASLKLKVSLVTRGSALNNRSLKVTIGKSVKTYKFTASGSRRYVSIPISSTSTLVKFTVLKSGKVGKSYSVNPRSAAKVWVGDYFSGVRTSESWANDKVTIHYHRANGDYSGWGVHAWSGANGGTSLTVSWASPIQPVSAIPDAWGVKYEIPLIANSQSIPIIIHNGNVKDPSTLDQQLNLAATKGEVWFEAGSDRKSVV